MKKVLIIGAVLVIAAIAGSINAVNAEHGERYAMYQPYHGIVPVNEVRAGGTGGNILISGTEDDEKNPTITVDGSGKIVVAYIDAASILENYVYLAYSSDDGSTWNIPAYVTTDSGVAASPDIIYMPGTGNIALSYVDPITTDYATHGWYISDITDTETYNGIRWGWNDAENYQYVTSTSVEYLFLQMVICDETGHGINADPTLIYWTQEWDHPSEIGGGYYDGESILKTSPASDPEMATGANRMIMVMQHDNATTGHSEIAYKMTVTDLNLLLTSGGGPGGMDKYADIEVWPWQGYLGKSDLADAAHPSVAASGSNVVVVYMSNDNVFGDWDIVCSYSSDNGDTWQTSTVAGEGQVDEMYPAVYMSGNSVYCAYMKNGNIYLVKSEDGGATWGEPEQVNDEDGTVVEAENSMDICSKGIVWTDTRNGNMDIYFAPLPAPIITLSISGGFGVKVTISNSGTEAAKNLPWSVDLSGLVFVGKHTEGTIASLEPGASQKVGPGLVFGIGPTTITVSAGGVTATAKGFVLGPLVMGVK